MKKGADKYPFVSIVIPTYNCAKLLNTCLSSIVKQDYPQKKYEILVVDGGSSDETKEVARKFKTKLINNPKRDPETAKSLGIKQARGEIVALVDSDNEIIKKDWLSKMVIPLQKDPELFGVESLYFSKKGESIFNTYSMLLHIADPFSRCIAGKLKINKKNGYLECNIPQNSAYPLGANGFLWNKNIIRKIGQNLSKFEESNFSYYALGKGYRKFARVPGYGIYHNHISSLGDFIAKRLKIGNKFLNRKDEKKKTWLGGVPRYKLVFSILYCVTIIGPTLEGLMNYFKTKQKAWLLHPIMSFISVSAYGYVLIKRKIRKSHINSSVNRKNYKIHWSLLAIVLVIILAFWDLPRGYFQQDEWHTFGRYIQLSTLTGKEFWGSVLQSGTLAHFTPLSLLFKMWIFQQFSLNANIYFQISILLHICTSLAVYYLIFVLIKQKLPATIGAIFFAINSSAHQAVTWLGNFEGTIGATLFGVLSLAFMIAYFQKNMKIYLLLSMLAVLTSLLFKEIALSFVLVLAFVLTQNKGRKSLFSSFIPLFIVIAAYLILRNLYHLFGAEEVFISTTHGARSFFGPLLYNLVTLPIKVVAQVVLPQQLLINISSFLADKVFPPFMHFRGPWKEFSFIIFDVITLFIGVGLIIQLKRIFNKLSEKYAFIIGFVLILFSLVPLLPLRQYLVYIDSRYLYVTAVGISIIAGVVFNYFYQHKDEKQTMKSYIFVIVLLMLANFVQLKIVISALVREGEVRQGIIQQILSQHPVLPEKVIFYFDSSESYYGLPPEEKIMPFQSGFGAVLLVAYQSKEKFPLQFFLNDFLWPISSQGYKEVNGRGFGFYRSMGALQKDVKNHNIPYGNIIAYRWKGQNLNLIDITNDFMKDANFK